MNLLTRTKPYPLQSSTISMAVAAVTLAIFTALVCSSFVGGQAAAWCVAGNVASKDELLAALNYACGHGADCSPILSGGACYHPDTISAHASYAFNSYYQRSTKAPESCDFSGTAIIINVDPSYGSCVYPSYSSQSPARGEITPIAAPGRHAANISPAPAAPAAAAPIAAAPTAAGVPGGGDTNKPDEEEWPVTSSPVKSIANSSKFVLTTSLMLLILPLVVL